MSKLRIFLAGGQSFDAHVHDEDLRDEDVDNVDELIEKTLAGTPRWAWLGDARIYTQAVSAVIEL